MTQKEAAKFKTLELMKRHIPKRKESEWNAFEEGFEWGWIEAQQAMRAEAEKQPADPAS